MPFHNDIFTREDCNCNVLLLSQRKNKIISTVEKGMKRKDMNVEKEIQWTEPENQTTDELLKKDLLNVDFSSIKVPSAKIHPEWESLLRLAQLRVKEELGPEFKLSEDLSLFSFYMFSSLSFDIVSSILITNMAGFMLDDCFDKFSTENEKIIQKFRNKDFPGNGEIDKWWRLAIKLCKESMGETALNHFLDVFGLSLSKSNEKFCGAIPLTDEDFLEWRCSESGYTHQFYLLFAGTGNQISDKLMQDPNYMGLNKQVALHASLINDLYSLRKEIRDDVYRFSYVYLKMTNNNISAQVAVNAIIQEIHDAERIARVYGEKLKRSNDPLLARYVDGMYEIMAGNHYWSTICKRYNDL